MHPSPRILMLLTRTLINAAALIVLLAASPVCGYSSSPVWKVSNGETQLYLGGTIHLLSINDYPLPDAFDKAYRNAERLILEIDIQGMNAPEVQHALMTTLIYPGDTTIADKLQPAAFARLKEYLEERNLYSSVLLKFKPGLLIVTLTTIELQKLDMGSGGVDVYFDEMARNDGKPRGFLESIDEQLRFLAEMGVGNEDALILQQLEDLENLPAMLAQLKESWRRGDVDGLARIAIDPWREQFPEIYETLLARRNARWISDIETMMESPEIEMVLVGALHLAGEDGLLALLADRGYDIENL